jgi:hypothetical protein
MVHLLDERRIGGVLFQAVLQQARGRRLLSDKHCTVDGTLLED